MRPLIAFVVLLYSVTANQEATNINIIKVGQQLTYDYEAHVEAGTKTPAEFGSEYCIHAKLQLQGLQPDKISLQLTNITYKLHNGASNLKTNTLLPIPTEAEALTHPFKLQYNSNGKIVALGFGPNEKDWSLNFKKAIASILQVDNEIIQNGFLGTVVEDSIYGNCPVVYDLIPDREGSTKLIKSTDLTKCKNKYVKNLENVDSNRVYFLERRGLDMVIKEVATVNEMLVQSGGYLKTSQKLELVSEGETEKKIEIQQPEKISKSLLYLEPKSQCENSLFEELLESGRSSETMTLDQIDMLVEDVIQYMNESHVNVEIPNILDSQVVYRCIRAFEKASLENFNEYFDSVYNETKPNDEDGDEYEYRKLNVKTNILLQLLPYVGTPSSVMFIRDLLRDTNETWITKKFGVQLLRDLPITLRCPNEKLLNELEDIRKLGEPDSELRKAGILAFTTLIRRTYENDEKLPVLEKWIGMFIGKLRGNETYETKLALIQGLANIQIGTVSKHLEKIVYGSRGYEIEPPLRIFALWAMKPQLVKQPSLANRVCWPLITNRQLSVTLRLTAYSIYVKINNPTLGWFLPLHRFLQSESNQFITNFHHNTLTTFSKLPNALELNKIATILLPYTRKPIEKIEGCGFYSTDLYTVDSYGFRIEVISVVAETTVFAEARLVSDTDMEIASGLIGLKKQGFASVSDFVFEAPSASLILRRQGFATSITDNERLSIGRLFLGLWKTRSVVKGIPLITIPFRNEYAIPNDLGLPIKAFDNIAVGVTVNVNGTDGRSIFDFKFKFSLNGARTQGVEVYNPVVDLWHGSQEVKTVALTIPFSVSVDLDMYDWEANIVLRRLSDEEVIGFTIYTQKQVYVNGEQNLEKLKRFGGEINTHEVATRGSSFRKNIMVAEYKCKTFGKNFQIQVFDCEDMISRGSVIQKFQSNLDDTFRNLPESSLFFELLALKEYILLTPGVGNCGLSARLLPINAEADHFEIALGFSKNNETESYKKRGAYWALYTNVNVKSLANETLTSYETEWYLGTNYTLNIFEFGLNISKKELGVEKERGHLEITYSSNCSVIDANVSLGMGEKDNYGIIDFRLGTTFSDEQFEIMNNTELKYPQCESKNEWNFLTKECVKVATVHRKLSVDYETHGSKNYLVQGYLNRLLYFGYRNMEYVLNAYNWNNDFNNIMQDLVTSNMTSISLEFPLVPEEWNLITKTKNFVTKFIGMPISFGSVDFDYMDLYKIYALDFSLFGIFSRNGPGICVVNKDVMIARNMTVVNSTVPDEWTTYWTNNNSEEDEERNNLIQLKNENGTLILSLRRKNNTLIVTPKKPEGFKLELNGEEIKNPSREMWFDRWYKAILIQRPSLYVFKYELESEVAFDGQSVRIEFPQSNFGPVPKGKCLETNLNVIDLP